MALYSYVEHVSTSRLRSAGGDAVTRSLRYTCASCSDGFACSHDGGAHTHCHAADCTHGHCRTDHYPHTPTASPASCSDGFPRLGDAISNVHPCTPSYAGPAHIDPDAYAYGHTQAHS